MDRFHAQFREVEHLYNAQPVDIVRESFGSNITNDLPDEGLIDANFLDILVTFKIKDGRAYLQPQFECYNEHGVFIGTETENL